MHIQQHSNLGVVGLLFLCPKRNSWGWHHGAETCGN